MPMPIRNTLQSLHSKALSYFPESSNIITRTIARIPVFFLSIAAAFNEVVLGIQNRFFTAQPAGTLSQAQARTQAVSMQIFSLLWNIPETREIKKAKLSHLLVQTSLFNPEKPHRSSLSTDDFLYDSATVHEAPLKHQRSISILKKISDEKFDQLFIEPSESNDTPLRKEMQSRIVDLDHLEHLSPLGAEEAREVRAFLQERCSGVPVSYISLTLKDKLSSEKQALISSKNFKTSEIEESIKQIESTTAEISKLLPSEREKAETLSAKIELLNKKIARLRREIDLLTPQIDDLERKIPLLVKLLKSELGSREQFLATLTEEHRVLSKFSGDLTSTGSTLTKSYLDEYLARSLESQTARRQKEVQILQSYLKRQFFKHLETLRSSQLITLQMPSGEVEIDFKRFPLESDLLIFHLYSQIKQMLPGEPAEKETQALLALNTLFASMEALDPTYKQSLEALAAREGYTGTSAIRSLGLATTTDVPESRITLKLREGKLDIEKRWGAKLGVDYKKEVYDFPLTLSLRGSVEAARVETTTTSSGLDYLAPQVNYSATLSDYLRVFDPKTPFSLKPVTSEDFVAELDLVTPATLKMLDEYKTQVETIDEGALKGLVFRKSTSTIEHNIQQRILKPINTKALHKPAGISDDDLKEIQTYLETHYHTSCLSLQLIQAIDDANPIDDTKPSDAKVRAFRNNVRALYLSQIMTKEELIQDLADEKEALELLNEQRATVDIDHLREPTRLDKEQMTSVMAFLTTRTPPMTVFSPSYVKTLPDSEPIKRLLTTLIKEQTKPLSFQEIERFKKTTSSGLDAARKDRLATAARRYLTRYCMDQFTKDANRSVTRILIEGKEPILPYVEQSASDHPIPQDLFVFHVYTQIMDYLTTQHSDDLEGNLIQALFVIFGSTQAIDGEWTRTTLHPSLQEDLRRVLPTDFPPAIQSTSPSTRMHKPDTRTVSISPKGVSMTEEAYRNCLITANNGTVYQLPLEMTFRAKFSRKSASDQQIDATLVTPGIIYPHIVITEPE